MDKEWVSVKDKMPNNGDEILATDGRSIVTCTFNKGVYRNGISYIDISGLGFSGYEWEFDFEAEEMTHWIPLPSLPDND